MPTILNIDTSDDELDITLLYQEVLKVILVYRNLDNASQTLGSSLAKIYYELLMSIDDKTIFSEKKNIVASRLNNFITILAEKKLNTHFIEQVKIDIGDNAKQLNEILIKTKDGFTSFKNTINNTYNESYSVPHQVLPELKTGQHHFINGTDNGTDLNIRKDIYRKHIENLHLNEKIDYMKNLLNSYNNEGILLFCDNKFSQSINKYNNALDLVKTITPQEYTFYKDILIEINKNLIRALEAYTVKFILEINYKDALQQLSLIITLLDESQDNSIAVKKRIAIYFVVMAQMNQDIKDYHLAEEHREKSLSILESPELINTNSSEITQIKNKLCINQILIGYNYYRSKQYTEAKNYYEKAFLTIESVKKSMPNEDQYFKNQSNSANIYYLTLGILSNFYYIATKSTNEEDKKLTYYSSSIDYKTNMININKNHKIQSNNLKKNLSELIMFYYERSLLFYDLNKYDYAIEDIKFAIFSAEKSSLHKDMLPIYRNDYIKFLSTAINNKTIPELIPLYYERGTSFYKLKNYDSAIDDLRKAIFLSERHAIHKEQLPEYIKKLTSIESKFMNKILDKINSDDNEEDQKNSIDTAQNNNNTDNINNNNNNNIYVSLSEFLPDIDEDESNKKRKHETNYEYKNKKLKILDEDEILLIDKIFFDPSDVIHLVAEIERGPKALLKIYKRHRSYDLLTNKFNSNSKLSRDEVICYCLPLFYEDLSNIFAITINTSIKKLEELNDPYFNKIIINFKIMLMATQYPFAAGRKKQNLLDNMQLLLGSNKSESTIFYEDLNLSGAQLANIVLPEVNLNFATLSNINLSGADLKTSSIATAKLNNAIFNSAKLDDVNFTDSSMNGANFEEAILKNANLSGTSCVGCTFTKANLQNANLLNADLGHSIFINADLSNANLLGANFEHANLTEANLAGAKFFPDDIFNDEKLFENKLLNFLNKYKIHKQRSKLYVAALNNVIALLAEMKNEDEQHCVQLTSKILKKALSKSDNEANSHSLINKINFFQDSDDDIIMLLTILAAYSSRKTDQTLDIEGENNHAYKINY